MRYEVYSYDEYLRALELLDQGFWPTEVCMILGWPVTRKSLLHDWKNESISLQQQDGFQSLATN